MILELRMVVVYTDYYMYLRSMGWPGGSALEYVYVCYCSCIGRRLGTIFAGWLVVRQIDGSCPIFQKILKVFLNNKD